jgi:hypothetical protein
MPEHATAEAVRTDDARRRQARRPAGAAPIPGARPLLRLTPAPAPTARGGGQPLPASVAAPISASLSVDVSGVRVHGDARSEEAAAMLSARAFTIGNDVFLGRGERRTDLPLMAHEVAHVVQQRGGGPRAQAFGGGAGRHEREAHAAAAAVVHGASFSVQEKTAPRVQRLGLSDALNYFADKARLIPGFSMFTVVLGINPINMARVERTPANILRAAIELIPGGALITQALDNYGIVDRVGAWVDQQLRTLAMTGTAIKNAIDRFLDSLSWTDIFDLGGVWERAKRIFSEPIGQIIDFLAGLVTGILRFIREAILRPLAALAEGTRGYDLLKAVLGQDPVTGEPVPRTAETLIGGFMKLIGQDEIWENIKKANAIPRAWAWFQGTLEGLLAFVRSIPPTFIAALQQLELADLVLLPRAFAKLGRVFGGFIVEFLGWAGRQVLSLLQIIFEVVAPGVMPYIQKAMGAFRTIIQDPIRFIGNLVRAGIQGFKQFASNFLSHLRNSLIQWLTGTLSGANIYIPQAFEIREIIKFVLSVLGLTWQNIRAKLVKAIGETAVTVLETAFDIVVTLVREGPAAAWEKIKEQLSNLKEMVMGEVMNFVRDRIVQAAITRLVTSLNPAGAFIQAIIAIYNTVMFVVERLRQIAQVVAAFIDSIAAIAAGNIGSAANKVEQTMGGLLTLVISFLARLVGLGRVSDAVKNVVNRIRAPIDRALDAVVAWVVATARRLGRLVAAGAQRVVGRITQWWTTRRRFSGADGQSHTFSFRGQGRNAQLLIESDPVPFQTFIQSVPASNPARAEALKIARQIDDLRNKANPADGTLAQPDLDKLQALWDQFSAQLALCFTGSAASAPQYGPPGSPSGWGTGMVILRLAKGLSGSAPSVSNPLFEDLNTRKSGTESAPSSASYYILGHLLNNRLGGPGNIWGNITPLSRSGNAQHDQKVESKLRDPVVAGRQFRYEVQVRYGRGVSGLLGQLPAGSADPVVQAKRKVIVAEQQVASSLLVRAQELQVPGRPAPSLNLTAEVANAVEQGSLAVYAVGQAPRRLTSIGLNDSIRNKALPEHKEALMHLPGIGPTRVNELIAEGPYSSWAAVSTKVNGVTEATVAGWRAGLAGGVQVTLTGTTAWA